MLKLKQALDNRPDLQKFLFTKGFVITNDDLHAYRDIYPFYATWNSTPLGAYQVWSRNHLEGFYQFERNGKTFFLIGHAYNPFTMEPDENNVLAAIAQGFEEGENAFFKQINQLTGIFLLGYIEGNNISFLLDCSGMQYGCYGEVNGHVYITSHMQLIGDLFQLEMDDFVKQLINYKWFKYMEGNYLPGDLTAFPQLKRIIPNIIVDYTDGKFSVKRFYPTKPITMCRTEAEYRDVITGAAKILQNTMTLISRKWGKPGISLTGGTDSNTTFAAANGLYDRFQTFSYIAMYRESVDAAAAKMISEKFNVKHTIFKVPDTNDEIVDFELYKQILSHNYGDIGPMKDNDTRKKIYLMQHNAYDVEVKSWVAETFRAYEYKYFGRNKYPQRLIPRVFTSLFKIYFLKRSLVWKSDYYFKKYFEDTKLEEHRFNYEVTDFFLWEMFWAGKCGLDIGTMKFCFDITIPYNNRELVDLLLKVKLEDRISDRHHKDLKRYLNSELSDMGIQVVNLNETRFRKFLANTYFTVQSRLPF